MPPLDFYISQLTPIPAQPKGPALEGKVVIITGANSGIGLAMAHQVAAYRPATLILAVRTLKTGNDALESILKEYPGTNAQVWHLDMADFANVREFSARVERELGVVDIAFLNAGMHPGFNPATPMLKTADGHEVTHQVNVLATVLLLLTLLPSLYKSSDPRVVITSSEVHAWADPGIIADAVKGDRSILAAADDEEVWQPANRYFISKLYLQLLVRRLIPALPRIKLVSVNPGMCSSNLGRDVKPSDVMNRQYLPLMFSVLFMRSAGRGATIVTSGAFAKESCEYWHKAVPCHLPSVFIATATGMKASKQYFNEVMALMEKVAPGCKSLLTIDGQ